ncbi:hypothetical protein CASFOL_012840 [Castilleja foliolosa]|uniref:Uncharacterized protein n=1 Tax=Castilleja foliolosa TaxID=1961234 RepID=A0ABD3DMB7_9LAMI
MFRKRLRHPYNYVLFFLCTLSISFMLGSVSSPNNDGIALQATGLLLLLMIGLTLFTFVAKRDLDFSWLLPFWFLVTLLLLASDVVETIFPEIVNPVFYRILVLMFWISIYFDRLNHFVHSPEID